MNEGSQPEKPRPFGLRSPASRRALCLQINPGSCPLALEATGLLRKVQVAYGRGSWPNIDEFLDSLDGAQDSKEEPRNEPR